MKAEKIKRLVSENRSLSEENKKLKKKLLVVEKENTLLKLRFDDITERYREILQEITELKKGYNTMIFSMQKKNRDYDRQVGKLIKMIRSGDTHEGN